MKLLFLDCETGGLDPDENSLLSIGMVSWEDRKIKNVIEIYIKEHVLRVTPSALAINKIDLRKFNEISVSSDEAWNKIKQFIYQNFGLHKENNIILAGMNVKFDIEFMKKNFGKKNFNKWFSHRSVDIQSILRFLYIKGTFSEDITSSAKAYKYFNINNGVVEHGALKDALCSVELFEKLLDLENYNE
jgi:DNA polymerase III epsilon subunit-like protein